jgi:MFS family permease
LNDVNGLRGWQWLFIVETIPSILLGFVVLIFLDNRVDDARWLTDEEKAQIKRDIDAEAEQSSGHVSAMDALKSVRVWLLGVAYFCIASSIYITSFWMPTLIKQQGINDPLQIGWLTAIPYTVAIVAMVLANISADRRAERRWHTAIPCFVAAIGLALSGTPGLGFGAAMFGLVLAAAGASTTQACFWSLPPMFLTGAAAAAGIALVNSLGNIAGMGALMVLRLPAQIVNR